jgi:hypothetical protein
MQEVDPNKVLAAAGAALVKDFIKSLTGSVSKQISKKYLQYFESFSPYLERTYTSCSNVKTIINKESPVAIVEIYVKSKFKCGSNTLGDDSLSQLARDGRRIIVTGFGGW